MGKNPKHRSRRGSLRGKHKVPKARKAPSRKKTVRCQIDGCKNKIFRSLSIQEWDDAVHKADLELDVPRGARKFKICKKHYKAAKKYKKKEDKLKKPRFVDTTKTGSNHAFD